jgi:hypothetical protein
MSFELPGGFGGGLFKFDSEAFRFETDSERLAGGRNGTRLRKKLRTLSRFLTRFSSSSSYSSSSEQLIEFEPLLLLNEVLDDLRESFDRMSLPDDAEPVAILAFQNNYFIIEMKLAKFCFFPEIIY